QSGQQGQQQSGQQGQQQSGQQGQQQSGQQGQQQSGQQGQQQSGQQSSNSQQQEGSGGESDSPDSRGKGDKKGESQSQTGDSAQQQMGGGQSNASQPPAGNQPGGQGNDSPPGSAQGGEGGNPGRSSGGGSSAAGGAGSEASSSDAANESFAEETTDMVLDYLERQKDQPDPELLNDLNWTDNDLRDFVNRWKKARDLGVNGDPQDRLKWQERLRKLNIKPPKSRMIGSSDINDTFQQMLDSGTRLPPPPALRNELDAFRKAIQGGK
ncbi:MAG: hypothetical protein AB8B50_21365, partial [Pirellulaceae bacterium]